MDWSEEKRETYSGRSEIHCSPSITTLFKRLGVTACKHIHIYQIQNKQTQVRSHTLHTHTHTHSRTYHLIPFLLKYLYCIIPFFTGLYFSGLSLVSLSLRSLSLSLWSLSPVSIWSLSGLSLSVSASTCRSL